MKRFSFFLTLLLAALLTGCGTAKPAEPVEQSIFAMDTYMTFVAYGSSAQEAVDASCRQINELEQLLSRTVESSDVYAVNSAYTASVDPLTASVVRDALRYADETGGDFDITIAPLVETWGIHTDTPYVPTQKEIDALLPLVGSEHITLSDPVGASAATLSADPGCAIDLGGIAKGYASDLIRQYLIDFGVESAAVSLGGNVYVHGSKPDGSPWTVAVQDPKNTEGYAACLFLCDSFVVTSGGYQRYFIADDGTVYIHIIDPQTGYPADSDLLSVSIIASDSGTRADAYSTALYVKGEQGAIDFWHTFADNDTPLDDFDMVLITVDGRLLYTPGLASKIIQPEGNSYDFQVIS